MGVKYRDGQNYPETYEDYVPPGAVARCMLEMIDMVYPIGSYYDTEDLNFNPNIQFGGTWELQEEYELVAWLSMKNASSIAASKNIKSVTGTTTRTITFNSPLKNNNYIVSASAEVSGSIGQEIIGVYNLTTTYFYIDFCNHAGTATNPLELNIAVFGLLETPTHKKWKRTA